MTIKKCKAKWRRGGERLIGYSIFGVIENIFLKQQDLGFDSNLAASWTHILGHMASGV